MVSFHQLMSAEMLDELLPTHEFFHVIDRRVILKLSRICHFRRIGSW